MTILVAVDFSGLTEGILETVRKFCALGPVKVWLLHVAEPEPEFVGMHVGPQSARANMADTLKEDHAALQVLSEGLRGEGLDVTALNVQGATVATIVREAKAREVDFIVMGSHGRTAIYDALVGSVSAGVIRQAPCPVLVVPLAKI